MTSLVTSAASTSRAASRSAPASSLIANRMG
jgi:hypothetical protein